MGMKMAVAFANIFMAKIEKEILRQSSIKFMLIFWKRFIDDVKSVWDTSRNEIEEFLLKANKFHPTLIKFTAEISETEATFLDTKVYKGVRFNKDSILHVQTHQGRRQNFSKGGSQTRTPSGDRRLYMVYTTAFPRVSGLSHIITA